MKYYEECLQHLLQPRAGGLTYFKNTMGKIETNTHKKSPSPLIYVLNNEQEGHVWGPGQNINSANQNVIFQITGVGARRSAAHGCKYHLTAPWDRLHQGKTNTFSDQAKLLHGV